MVELRTITRENHWAIINMKLPPEQKFVAPNAVSLAQAWVFYDVARPFAIYNDEELVGFLMLEWDEKAREVGIWRFMIAQEHQQKGYGTQAMERAIEMIRAEAEKFDVIYLSYVPGNEIAKRLYEKMGFRETGEVDEEGEIIMAINLKA